MRSWEARGDTAVTDEPLYAWYLRETGLDHPGRADVLAAQSVDQATLEAALLGPVPEGQSIWYQKHMAHHLIAGMESGPLAGEAFVHAMLVRDPGAMVASLARALGRVPELPETGLPQQVALLDRLTSETGRVPAVLDADEVLTDPATELERFCHALGVDWTPSMLQWTAGPRATDGVWAPHWYAAVEQSTSFGPPREPVAESDVDASLRPLVRACRPLYDRLRLVSG